MVTGNLARRTAWVHADQAKARKAIGVPLSATAVIVIREQIGKHSTHVFSYRGKPVRQVNTKTWRQALKRVGIEDFRWHDLRHTWASWHVQAGTPLPVLQELGAGKCSRWCGSTHTSRAIISCNTWTACTVCGS
jgi:integrase